MKPLPDPRTPQERYDAFARAVAPVNRDLANGIRNNLDHARRSRSDLMRRYWVNTARFQHRWLLSNRRKQREFTPPGQPNVLPPLAPWPRSTWTPYSLTPLAEALSVAAPAAPIRMLPINEWPAGDVAQMDLFGALNP